MVNISCDEMIFHREYFVIFAIIDSSSNDSIYFPLVVKRHNCSRKMCDVNLAILEEEKSFDLWMVENNRKTNVVAIKEGKMERVSVRREVCDSVW